MTPQDVLLELLARVVASYGAPVFVGSEELSQWSDSVVAVMKAQKLLAKGRPAVSVLCPGCERECVMLVHVLLAQGTASRAFVVCDKRNDINQVPVPIDHLEQWQVSGESITDLVARLLDLRRPNGDTHAGRWEIGMMKGAKHASHLVLLADGELKLSLAGHLIALGDVLEVKGDRFAVDKRMLIRLLDQPVAGAGDAESAEQRRERLKARVRAEKARGTKAFL